MLQYLVVNNCYPRRTWTSLKYLVESFSYSTITNSTLSSKVTTKVCPNARYPRHIRTKWCRENMTMWRRNTIRLWMSVTTSRRPTTGLTWLRASWRACVESYNVMSSVLRFVVIIPFIGCAEECKIKSGWLIFNHK